MRRVKWLLNGNPMYTLYCSLVLPYIGYCCEIWGNTYKNRIQPLYILQKCAIRMCGQLEYRAHSKPAFAKFNALICATCFDACLVHPCDTYLFCSMQSCFVSHSTLVFSPYLVRSIQPFLFRSFHRCLSSLTADLSSPFTPPLC